MSAHLRLVDPRHENRSVRRSYAVPVRPAKCRAEAAGMYHPKELERLTKAAKMVVMVTVIARPGSGGHRAHHARS
jgi:hypothetical protein